MTENVTQDFRGTQENMCEAAYLGINLYEKIQPKFQSINVAYTKTWGDDFRKEIDAALALPDAGSRRAVPAVERDKLVPFAQDGIVNWLTLSGLITSIAPENEVQSLLNIAGQANYNDACRYKWAKVKSLLGAGATFISDNTDWLLNGGKSMDPGFPATYNAAMNAYNTVAASFFNARQDLPFGTSNKVEALNAVYAKLNAMFADGRKINRFNKLMRDKFTYTSVLAIVQGHGVAGVRFSFFEEDTTVRVNTSTAIFAPGGKQFPCSKTGVMTCRLAAGTYTCTITTPGFDTITMEITLRPGILTPRKIKLQKAAQVSVAV